MKSSLYFPTPNVHALYNTAHLLMEKNYFYIDIVPVLVKEVFEEVGNTFQSDVTAHHNMPAK